MSTTAIPPLITCTTCGYDLAGLALPCTCPECGARNTHDLIEAAAARRRLPPWIVNLRTVWAGALLAMIPGILIVDALHSDKGVGGVVARCLVMLMIVIMTGIPFVLIVGWFPRARGVIMTLMALAETCLVAAMVLSEW